MSDRFEVLLAEILDASGGHAKKNRLFDVSFRDDKGVDSWREVLAEDFWEAEMVSFGFVPCGADFYIYRVSDDGYSHECSVAYPREARLRLECPVGFSPIDSDFSDEEPYCCCGEW